MLYLFEYISHKLFVVSLLDVLWSINTINLCLFSKITDFCFRNSSHEHTNECKFNLECRLYHTKTQKLPSEVKFFFHHIHFKISNFHNNIFNQNHIYISLILICTLTQGGHWLSSDTRLLVNNASIFKTNLSKGTMFTKLLCM